MLTYINLNYCNKKCISMSGLNTNASTTEVKSSQSISTVISLLTTLCRGSKSVSHVCKFFYIYM